MNNTNEFRRQNLIEEFSQMKHEDEVQNQNFQERPQDRSSLELKQRLIEYSELIGEVLGKYRNAFELIEPKGKDGRSIDEEYNQFIKDSHYVPEFSYPKLQGVDFLSAQDSIQGIREMLRNEQNDQIKTIIEKSIIPLEDTISFLKAIQAKDDQRVFEYSKKIYGDIDEELAYEAQQIISSMPALRSLPQSEIEDFLGNKSKNSAEDVKYIFEEGMKLMGIPLYDKEHNPKGWQVAFVESPTVVVRQKSIDSDIPTICVPKNRTYSSIEVMKLLSHEIGTHVRTNENNSRSGLGANVFGKDYEVYQEGLAKIAEMHIVEEMTGKTGILAEPYYVLAMKKAKEGANFREVFEYLVEQRVSVDYQTDIIRKEKGLKPPYEDIQEKRREEAQKESWKNCRRIFRGFHNFQDGGKYFPKDKAYLEGALVAKQLEEKGLEEYLAMSKCDPVFISEFRRLGVITQDLVPIRKIAKKFWLENIAWYFQKKS